MPGKGTPRSSYRLGEETRFRLKHISRNAMMSETEVIRRLVAEAWEKHEALIRKIKKNSAKVS